MNVKIEYIRKYEIWFGLDTYKWKEKEEEEEEGKHKITGSRRCV